MVLQHTNIIGLRTFLLHAVQVEDAISACIFEDT
jgi:hypothetical protein